MSYEMGINFLEQESKQANAKLRKRLSITMPVFICLIAFIGFAIKDSLGDDYESRKVVFCLIGLCALMLVFFIIGLILSGRTAHNGKNLRLPFEDRTKEQAADIINREMAEEKDFVNEYIYDFSDGKKPYGEKVILLPSYLLLCRNGIITAIPHDKIYWLCSQYGIKGRSSYVVRLLVFTEEGVYSMDGVEPDHVDEIAHRLYRYLPDAFSGYDVFKLSYELEKLYDKNRAGFVELYQQEMKKRGLDMTTPQLATDRLNLREIRPEDVNEIYHCWMQDEEVSRYMYWKASSNIDDTKEFVEYELGNIENNQWYRWIITLKSTSEVIGTCLIFYNDEENSWDISYNLGKKYWGKGYITEAMKTVMSYAENTLGIHEFIAIHAIENPASGRIIEKLGFRYEKDVPYECNGGEITTTGKYYRYSR